MKTAGMWKQLAKYYDLIYSWKNYEKESSRIHKLIQKYKRSNGNDLLEVACGTGSHIRYLKDNYHVTGIDLNEDMLKIARKKNPELKFHRANMVSFDLEEKFNAITCLFSSIGYVKSYTNLRRAIASFSKHLRVGGILIVEPFFTKETFKEGVPFATFVDEAGVKIARMNVSRRQGDLAILDFHFLVATEEGVKYLRDRHEVGLFDVEKFLKIMEGEGFDARFLKRGLLKDRGLYVGVKREHPH